MQSIKFNKVDVKNRNSFCLKDINLNLHSNCIYGVIGKNGAGKTTLFRVMLGLVPYTGTIEVDKKVYTYSSEKTYLEKIGAMLSFPEILNKYTIKEIINEFKVYMKIDECSIEEMFEKLELDISLETRIKELSLGMKKKLHISLSLMKKTELLLWDEPFNGMDYVGISQVKKMAKEYKNKNRILCISSHSLQELYDIVDGIIIMEKGKVIECISMNSIFNQGFSNLTDYMKFKEKGIYFYGRN